MPILSGDVKLLKSAKMADALEDGGGLAGLQIAQGVSNRFLASRRGCGVCCQGRRSPRQALRRSRQAVGAAKRATGAQAGLNH